MVFLCWLMQFSVLITIINAMFVKKELKIANPVWDSFVLQFLNVCAIIIILKIMTESVKSVNLSVMAVINQEVTVYIAVTIELINQNAFAAIQDITLTKITKIAYNAIYKFVKVALIVI